MQITIIGDGNVGQALARGLTKSGHNVTTTGNDPARVKELAASGEVVFEAKATVRALASGIGFDAVDAGPLANARLLEPMAFLNIQMGFALGLGPEIGLKVVH